MSEVVERVAKAIDTALGGLLDDDGGRLSSEIEERLKFAARAAIEAMREPTEAMYRAVDESDDLIAGDGRLNPALAVDAWKLMIDAELGKVDA